MVDLVKLLKSANTMDKAFMAIRNADLQLGFDRWLPEPARFRVLASKKNYFIGLWEGNMKKKEFFANYDMLQLFYVPDQ
ncbi:hypothetical protein KKF81_03965 [Candidatus Micrarchaeota archaeon]|nr:hypothetical protein [Candidatus Micrarchaeota archaeon]MBU1166081.1 hypothetical protein [Candidatus Micrarchaeota archaeon]MBU1886671.1 hypothetical protein [Candidatus Micrarchaeota archaeon]